MSDQKTTTELGSEAQTQNPGLSFEELEYLGLSSPWSRPEDSPVLIPEKIICFGTEKRRFLAIYWDKQDFHRDKRGSSLDC